MRYISVGLLVLALGVAGCGGGSSGTGDVTIDLGDLEDGAAVTVSAETADGWAEKWCQVQLGMTLTEAR